MEDGGIRREDEVSGKIRMIDEDRERKMGEYAIKGGRMRALKGKTFGEIREKLGKLWRLKKTWGEILGEKKI